MENLHYMRISLLCFSTAMLLLMSAGAAHADCTSPASPEGGLNYDTVGDKYQFCDGTNWLDIGTGTAIFEVTGGAGSEVVSSVNANAPYTTADFVFGSPQLADDANVDHRKRMFFDKSKAAFRAGQVWNNQWDDANVGNNSVVFGFGGRATGNVAIAMGNNPAANGDNTVAIGSQITSSGSYSMALGRLTTASATDSIAIGLGNAAGAVPEVSGTSSFGIFMGDQSGVDLAQANTMALMGGSLGVGTVVPTKLLHISGDDGDLLLNQNSGFNNVVDVIFSVDDVFKGGVGLIEANEKLSLAIDLGLDGVGGFQIAPDHSSTPFLTMEVDGDVGIGTTTPATLLDVAGTIRVADGGEGCAAGVAGAMRYNTNTIDYCNGTTWTTLAASGGAIALDDITAADGTATINNAANAINWDWALTAAGSAFTFGENTAATGGSDDQYILSAETLATSTAIPLFVNNIGAGASFRVDDAASDTTPFVIDSTGNVGIGTVSPSAELHVADAGDATLRLEADTDNVNEDDNPSLYMSQDNDGTSLVLGMVGFAGFDSFNNAYTGTTQNAGLLATSVSNLQFGSNGAVHMTVEATGDVGIGTNAPAEALDVVGNINLTGEISHPGALTIRSTYSGASTNAGAITLQTGSGNQDILLISGDDGGDIDFIVEDATSNSNCWKIIDGITVINYDCTNNYFWFDNSVNVGIGTTTPRTSFDVVATDAIILPSGTTAQRPGSPVGGMLRYNTTASTDALEYYDAEGTAWVQLTGGGGGGGAALDDVTAADGTSTINNAANAINWDWALTAAGSAFTFGENTAATGGSDDQYILSAETLATSTAIPLFVNNLGAGDSFRVNDVASDTTPFIIDNAGQVGIGIAPTAPLHIEYAGGTDTTNPAQMRLINSTSQGSAEIVMGEDVNGSGGSMGIRYFSNAAGSVNLLQFGEISGTTLTPRVTIDRDTNRMGIGTTAPSGTLHTVGGNVYFDGGDVRVDGGNLTVRDSVIGGTVDLRIRNTTAQNSSRIVFEEGSQGDNFSIKYNTDGGTQNALEFIGDTTVRMRVERDTLGVGIGDFSSDTIDSALHLETGDIRLDGGAANQAGCFRFNDTADELEYSDDCTTFTAINSLGGGGTPAGSDTELQYNNGGAMGASANLAWNDTTNMLTIDDVTGGNGGLTLTTDQTGSINDLLTLENTNGGGNFAGMQFRVQSTDQAYLYASDSGILLETPSGTSNVIALRTEGTTRLRIESDGDVTMPGTGALQVHSGTTAQRPGTAVNGMTRYNSTTSKMEAYEAGAWTNMIGGAALDDITAADGTNTIANGANAQLWNWALSASGQSGIVFGETTASTGGSGGDQAIVFVRTLASSTSMPLLVENLGAGLSFAVTDEATDSTAFVVDADGNVGIKNSSPGVALDVTGDIEYTGTITDVSDMRLKDNIEPLIKTGSLLERINQIDTYSFTMKDDESGRTEFGVMAQELENIFPELVHTAKDEIGTKSVNYVGLIAPMIEATKELKAENAALKAEISELKSVQHATNESLNDISEQVALLNKVVVKDNTKQGSALYMLFTLIFMLVGMTGFMVLRLRRP